MPMFVWKKTNGLCHPAILYAVPDDYIGRQDICQYHHITDDEAMSGVASLMAKYKIRVRVRAVSVKYNMRNYPL